MLLFNRSEKSVPILFSSCMNWDCTGGKMAKTKYVLMSIKPCYAKLIKAGKKTVELRRVVPKITSGDFIIIYESKPVQRITAICEVETVLSAKILDLWNQVGNEIRITKDAFEQYFAGKECGSGIKLKNVSVLEKSKTLSELSPNLLPPQSYRYISALQFSSLFRK